MDVFIFQKLEEKTSRINDIWYRGDRGNVLDLESLDPEEVKFALLTDIEAIAANIIKKEIKQQERKILSIEGNISTLNDFKKHYNEYENYKKRLEEAIWSKLQQMQEFEYIRSKPTEEKLKKLDKENSEKIKKDIALFDEINKFLEKTPYEDRELLMIARKLQRRFDYFETYTVNYFKESLSIIKKAERTILAGKRYTIDDDIEKVIKDYGKDLEKENEVLKDIQSEKHKNEVAKDVKEKKSAMKINGKSTEERAQEFAELNHLLSYKFPDIDPQVCIIPGKEKPPETDRQSGDKEKRIRVARVKAQAKLKLLELVDV